MRILLVEDVDDVRSVIRTMLEDLGHDVVEAANGKEALTAALKHPPAIVLMDLSMPGVDGFSATAALRAMTVGQVPVIAITALAKRSWHQKALEAGFDAYLRNRLLWRNWQRL